ncbi:MAG: hypothetical protein JXR37_12575 [Kiritimatiellae bacterium]|nr:hypothetical protein [Kiritimatiellia bacterium]
MKIVLLTTNTTHHAYFACRVNERFPLDAVCLETRQAAPPFETFHPFEARRDEYERDVLLAGAAARMDELTRTHTFENVNGPGCLSALEDLKPEVVIVFGTGRLRAAAIEMASVACLNLHGGNPEEYRGLDTHLWAIYHRDFDNLVTTLHHVDADLDTGDIVAQAQLRFSRESRLHHLRAVNTKACVELVLLALSALDSRGALPCRRQLKRGRYYSHMPAVLKDMCLERFERHVAGL